jgi:hypothetical protein
MPRTLLLFDKNSFGSKGFGVDRKVDKGLLKS